MPNNQRQAVVIIHGIGEQRPMETLRSFLGAVLSFDGEHAKNEYWSKYDFVSEGFEHRQFSLPGTRRRPVTDIYEFYWAHLFEKASASTLISWVVPFLTRRTEELPERVVKIRQIFWFLVILFGAIFIFAQSPIAAEIKEVIPAWMMALISLAGAGILYVFSYFALNQFADAARYLDASPKNVAARNAVRKQGVDFLNKLHKADREYDRIIVCGHSLGSIIAYDILQFAWLKHCERFDSSVPIDQPIMEKTKAVFNDGSPDDIRALQRDLFAEQRKMGSSWLVTDLVTMGSPLALADALLAPSEKRLKEMQDREELATCPPTPDRKEGTVWRKTNFTNKDGQPRTIKTLKRSAVFAPTVWTNIYFEPKGLIHGDPIAGPIADLFGRAVKDVKVGVKRKRPYFAHTLYWSMQLKDEPADEGSTHPFAALKDALALDTR